MNVTAAMQATRQAILDSGAVGVPTFTTFVIVSLVCIIGALTCFEWAWEAVAAMVARRQARANLARSTAVMMDEEEEEEEEAAAQGGEGLTDPPLVIVAAAAAQATARQRSPTATNKETAMYLGPDMYDRRRRHYHN